MKSKISNGMKKYLKTISYIIVSILVGITAVYATSKLTPPDAVSNTMYSLSDIFNLASGTTTTEGTGTISTTPSLAETGKTLTEVYTAISTEIAKLSSSVIASGTIAFGITGKTSVVDTEDSNATANDIISPKTAYVNGVKITGVATAGTPELTWQTPDPALNLCWSHNQYEIDNGCTVGSGFIDADPGAGTIALGAVEYCKYLNTDGTTLALTEQNIWHLPTIQEYQSITDFTKFNNATSVTGFAEGTHYWSSAQSAGGANGAWGWSTYNGYISSNVDNNSVRCAH